MLAFAFKYGYMPGKACTSRDACGSGYCKMKVLQNKKKKVKHSMDYFVHWTCEILS